MLALCLRSNRSKCFLLLAAWGVMLPSPSTLLSAPLEPGERIFGTSDETFELESAGDEGWRTAMGAPTECGDPLAVNCFGPIGSFDPYCDDFCDADSCAGCCDTVCSSDPFCCDVAVGFDGFCVSHAQQVCPCVLGQDEPPNDECAAAIELVGLGDFPVSNQCATVGGPEHSNSACHDGSNSGLNAHGLDVWYTHTASFTGQLVVSTCGLIENTWDSIILFYEGCDCGTLGEPIGCNNNGIDDNFKECLNGSSLLRVDVIEGTCYTIRLGSSFNDVSGSGTMNLRIGSAAPCPIDDQIPPEAIPEPEPCGENTNGGCDNIPDLPPAFTPVQCGDIIHGTAFGNPLGSDSDWYELVISEPTLVTLSLLAESGYRFGYVETDPKGSGDCANVSGQLLPEEVVPPCKEIVISTLLLPGTWWPFVAPLLDDVDCGQTGSDYLLTISCACDDPSICIDGDACTDDACDLLTGNCLNTPTDCDDNDLCTHDSCDSEVGCIHTPFNVPVECDDNDPCTTDTCDSLVGCVHTLLCTADGQCDDGHPCTIDVCGADGCCTTLPGCVIDADCLNPDPCLTGLCGAGGCCVDIPDCTRDCDCDDQDECTTDICTAGGCCENTPINVAVACDDGNACTVETCDLVLGCVSEPVDAAAFCDDADACTTDTCDAALGCQNTPIDVGLVCADNDPCTDAVCDPLLGCGNVPIDPAVDCNDNNACTDDICSSTIGCLNVPIDVPVVCDDGESCTTDICDPATGCVNIPECFGAADCDDLDECTTDSCGLDGCCRNDPFCLSGCPASDLNSDGAVNAADLAILLGAWGTDPVGPPDFNEDGEVGAFDLAILLGEWGPCAQQAGTCCAIDADCDDQNACTTDVCAVGGCCENTPGCTTNAQCEDGDPCTIDTCSADGCCESVPNDCLGPEDCDDGVACTTDTCTPEGCCEHTPDECAIDSDCNDGDLCTTDTCVGGCCENTPECTADGFCSDGDPCTTDICGVDGCCTNTPVNCQLDAECDDGDPCTVDVCDGFGCCVNTIECAANADCDDLNECTSNICSLPEGCCVFVPHCESGVDCDDGNPCTADTCSPEGCCVYTPDCTGDAQCDDGDPCTTGTCDADGCCVHTPDCLVAGDCNDGNPCTTGTCDAGGCCVHTPDCLIAGDCDDGNTCTTESCSPDGCCVNTPDCETECDCDDLDECTTDSCDESGCCISVEQIPCCTLSDMNGDDLCTIVFDVDLFVQCVFLGDCVGLGGEDLVCPADCNCDGLATIVFDVDCFLNNVFINGACGECPIGFGPGAGEPEIGERIGRGFTIGGAVFTDGSDPLMSGLGDVTVKVRRTGGKGVISTTTNPLGLWRIDDVPTGKYTVSFRAAEMFTQSPKRPMKISVNEENRAANLSIKWLVGNDGGRP